MAAADSVGGGRSPGANAWAAPQPVRVDIHVFEASPRAAPTVRDKGWAQAIGEREDDLNAVAAPVFDRAGKLAAILGVQGPAARFSPRAMRAAVELLTDKAAQISAIL